ncbi:HK97-gp10 family putative phage morphogenesis protein [Leminorella grimontii]|uniref:HK97-gp10 family putative phage morphogenesis protein n=1 Tax=Leminorella grimontii TaxID=82981 RepID=UPI003220163A
MEIKGLDELARQLERLDQKVSEKILRQAGREAMEVVKEDMQANAGFDDSSGSEHMRDSIKITTKKRRNGVSVFVGPSKRHRMKAVAQEYGTIKQVPQAFIRPALDYNKRAVLNKLTQALRDALQSYRNIRS